MSLIKTLTIDGFYTDEEAKRVGTVVSNLHFEASEFGREVPNFNMVPPEADQMFSSVLHFPVTVDPQSGIFRYPQNFIHFESFESLDDWLFVCALEPSTFNLFEHKSGARTALDGHAFKYRNLFEWNLKVNYLLDPGQGIFFRPWLFHSFDQGIVQMFRLKENR